VLVAEVVKHFLPKLVDLHNYTPANSVVQKTGNWTTLNRKVFCKLSFGVPENVVKGVVNAKPGVIEFVLNNLRVKIEKYMGRKEKGLAKSQETDFTSDIYNGDSDVLHANSSEVLSSGAYGHHASMISRHVVSKTP
jgi:hypothetical protein